MKTILLATSALLLASAAPAFAQDTTAPAADTSASTSMPSDAPTFTGPRAEIFGGWDRVGVRTRFNNPSGGGHTTLHDHDSAWTGGGLIGYDYPIGDKMTVGVLGSYSISTAKSCAYSDGTGTGGGCIKAGRQLEGGARFGYKATPRTLLYVKGSYVNGRVSGAFSDGVDYVRGHEDRDGWRAGAGAEYAVNKHAYVKVEYDYTRFKSIYGEDLGQGDDSLRYDRNQVLAGFGIHF